jgi:hypothetical protein
MSQKDEAREVRTLQLRAIAATSSARNTHKQNGLRNAARVHGIKQ